MAKVIGDVMYPSGKYIKDGEEKTRWIRCGMLLETDKGLRIKLDCIPIVTDPAGLWMSVFEKSDSKPGQSSQQPAQAQSQSSGTEQEPEEDMPF